MRRFSILVALAAILASCSAGGGSSGSLPNLPTVERLRNTGSYSVQLDAESGLEGDFSLPLIDGPFPAVVIADDASLSADQVKEEARLLARHGFAVLGFKLGEGDPVRQFARAGATVIGQPGVGTSEAVLVLLSGDPVPAFDAHRRLSGYRTLVVVDPVEAPELSLFAEMSEPIVVMLKDDAPMPVVESWRDGLSLVSARTAVLMDSESSVPGKIMTPERREVLSQTLLEFLQ